MKKRVFIVLLIIGLSIDSKAQQFGLIGELGVS
jgi:hypothetical protein